MLSRPQFILIAIAIVSIVGLYFAPRVVVDNKNNNLETEENTSSETQNAESHSQNIPEDTQKELDDLKKSYKEVEDKTKKAIFADSLSVLYLSINFLDSAAYYQEEISALFPEEKNWMNTGNAYFEAFKFAINREKANQMGEKARTYFEKILEVNPTRYEAKTKIGVTYVSSSNPMKGISLIREVLTEDPENEYALFSLGILSMQSGQYNKAISRFEELLKINPQYDEAKLYLGESYANVGQVDEAIKIVRDLQTTTQDSLLRVAAEQYLNELEKN